jgi:membrane associated rhomboid family serine protease
VANNYLYVHAWRLYAYIFQYVCLILFWSILEAHWGGKRFINFYLITGIGALLLQWGVQAFEVYQITGSVFNPGAVTVDLASKMAGVNLTDISIAGKDTLLDIYTTPMVGASGAIFG